MDRRTYPSLIRLAVAVAAVVGLRSTPASADEAAAGAQAPSANNRVPFLDDAGQRRYQEYLTLPLPRAFAISEKGAYAATSGTIPKHPRRPTDPKARALELCREAPGGMGAGSDCTLYSVDNEVVYGKSAAPAAFTPVPPGMPGPAMAPAAQQPAAFRRRLHGLPRARGSPRIW